MRTLPIEPKAAQTNPIVASVDRWRVVGHPGILIKTYLFRNRDNRDAFVVGALGHEAQTLHSAEYVVKELEVTVSFTTPNVGATSIDKDSARMLDVLFRDIVYSRNSNGI